MGVKERISRAAGRAGIKEFSVSRITRAFNVETRSFDESGESTEYTFNAISGSIDKELAEEFSDRRTDLIIMVSSVDLSDPGIGESITSSSGSAFGEKEFEIVGIRPVIVRNEVVANILGLVGS